VVNGDLTLRDGRVDEALLSEARIVGLFDASGARIGHLAAGGSTFDGDVDFDGATITDEMDLTAATVHGILAVTDVAAECTLHLEKLSVDGDASFANSRIRGVLAARYAQFHRECNGTGLETDDVATFRGSRFGGVATFDGATFHGEVRFDMDAAFETEARFVGTVFERRARFSDARFGGPAEFTRGRFDDVASFSRATFESTVTFGERTEFDETATFEDAVFEGPVSFDTAVLADVVLTGATGDAPVRFRNARTAALDLRETAFSELDCRGLVCDRRLTAENATIMGDVGLSSGTIRGDAVFRDAVVEGSFTAQAATFGGELDCRRIDIGAAFVVDGDGERMASVHGCLGLVAADLTRCTLGVFPADGPIRADEAVIRRLDVEPSACQSAARITLRDAVVDSGTLSQPPTGALHYDLRDARIGAVTLAPGPDDADPFDPYWIARTRFDGFEFSRHRAMLDGSDWDIHGAPPERSLRPAVLETTYLAAKNGANEVSDHAAASAFFKRELRYRRSGYLPAAGDGRSIRNGFAWLANYTLDLAAGYGEAPSRVLLLSAASVLSFAALSFVFRPTSLTASAVGGRLLFSFQNFTAFMFGAPQLSPSVAVRWLAAIEGFVGAFLIGLFIFALTRSVHR